jgi:PilZ domain-containing protein
MDTSFVPRKFEREPVRKIAHILVNMGEEQLGAGAYTLDMSARGSRVRTPLELTPGQIVEFQPDDSNFVTRCRVVWRGSPASASEGQAGIEFLETFPSPSEV